MRDYGPVIGEDFTRIGQQAMTSEIRRILIEMKSFQFSFRGDEKFEPERVNLMEQMLHKQIEALLSREILYAKDVFIPEQKMEQNIATDRFSSVVNAQKPKTEKVKLHNLDDEIKTILSEPIQDMKSMGMDKGIDNRAKDDDYIR
jgi:hypothetical protein